jgi:hypothetical protein
MSTTYTSTFGKFHARYPLIGSLVLVVLLSLPFHTFPSTMADNNDGAPNADLAAILATLASLQQPNAAPVPAQVQHQGYDQSQSYQGYSVQPVAQAYPPQQPADPRLLNRPAPQQYIVPKPQDRASTPLIDPATITEWKQGLRCVSKIATQTPDFAASIRKVCLRSRIDLPHHTYISSVDERAGRSRQAMVSHALA